MQGVLVCRPQATKEKKPKLVPMLEEDIALVKSLPAALPDLPFFRWPDGKQIYAHAFYHSTKIYLIKMGTYDTQAPIFYA